MQQVQRITVLVITLPPRVSSCRGSDRSPDKMTLRYRSEYDPDFASTHVECDISFYLLRRGIASFRDILPYQPCLEQKVYQDFKRPNGGPPRTTTARKAKSTKTMAGMCHSKDPWTRLGPVDCTASWTSGSSLHSGFCTSFARL